MALVLASSFPLWLLACYALGLAFVGVRLGLPLLRVRGRQLAPPPAAWLAVALTLAATVWSSHRYAAGNLKLEIEKATYFAGDGEIEIVRDFVALTDRGLPIQLFRWKKDQPQNTPLRPLAEFGPANCHGWVFTSGDYYLECDDVERILEDNGYEPCDSPQAEDLIVYRNPSGGISHTGLVRAAFLGGTPIIESKWGLGGWFVHGPEEQPYGDRYSYYRSARQGHTLAVLPVRPTTSIANR